MTTLRIIRAAALIAGSVCLLDAVSGTSFADHEETERRLKAVGIKTPLREKIHLAIDRGVAHLLAHQMRDGRFEDDPDAWYDGGARSLTPLCALALSHSGTSRGRTGSRRALEFIFSAPSSSTTGRTPAYPHFPTTYEAGLTLMLLVSEDGPRNRFAGTIATRLARSQCEDTGWWGYQLRFVDRPNLSTSQFAALGLWAGERLGTEVDRGVWKRHLESLCDTQGGEGSWSYYPRGRSLGWAPYATGTFMGFANLVLAKALLGDELSKDPKLRNRARKALKKATSRLHCDGAAILDELGKAGYPHYFYNLYALEKACIFGDIECLKDRPWYLIGATTLVDIRNEDGGWGWNLGDVLEFAYIKGSRYRTTRRKSDLIQTSFALLFLLRSSQAYHPVSPRPVGAGATPVTPDPRENR